jgi:hypothetical protein
MNSKAKLTTISLIFVLLTGSLTATTVWRFQEDISEEEEILLEGETPRDLCPNLDEEQSNVCEQVEIDVKEDWTSITLYDDSYNGATNLLDLLEAAKNSDGTIDGARAAMLLELITCRKNEIQTLGECAAEKEDGLSQSPSEINIDLEELHRTDKNTEGGSNDGDNQASNAEDNYCQENLPSDEGICKDDTYTTGDWEIKIDGYNGCEDDKILVCTIDKTGE